MLTQKEFTDFKNKYLVFKKKNATQVADNFIREFKRIKNTFEFFESVNEKIDKHEARNFNLFSILGLEHKEVTTHTAFLAELLNTRGSHGQKNLFLRLFLTDILDFPESDSKNPHWLVIKESDYIDLRIVNYRLSEPNGVFVENKIYTEAHSGQLSRYYEKWKTGFKCNGRFCYLTIHGNEKIVNGFDKDYPEDIVTNDDNWRRLSYKKDIYDWLNSSLELIEAPKVKLTVLQYLDLIKKL